LFCQTARRVSDFGFLRSFLPWQSVSESSSHSFLDGSPANIHSATRQSFMEESKSELRVSPSTSSTDLHQDNNGLMISSEPFSSPTPNLIKRRSKDPNILSYRDFSNQYLIRVNFSSLTLNEDVRNEVESVVLRAGMTNSDFHDMIGIISNKIREMRARGQRETKKSIVFKNYEFNVVDSKY
jgi:hypothetical protein